MFLKPKNSGAVVGLAFADDAIHAVAVRMGANGAVQVEQVLQVPLPPGALADRGIGNAAQVTEAVSQVLAGVTVPVQSVVIGLPSRSTLAHALTVPPVPLKERRAIVRGEIALLNLLPPGEEAFDFQIFARPEDAPVSNKDNAPKGDAAFFFAAEQHVIEDFRAAVSAAGVSVAAIEPGEYAATRVACQMIEAKPHGVALSVGANHTYLQFFRQGKPVYARRLDTGGEQIASDSDQTSVADGRAMLGAVSSLAAPEPPAEPMWQLSSLLAPGTPAPEAPPTSVAEPVPGVPSFYNPAPIRGATSAREHLMMDVLRSIDYFGREFRLDLGDLDVVLLPNDPRLADLPPYAAQQLEQAIETVSIEATGLTFPASPLLENAGGMAFAPALGLALGQLPGPWAALVPLDLGHDTAEAARARRAPRILIAACAGGLAFLGVGWGIGNFVEQQATPIRADLDGNRAALKSLTSEELRLRADTSQQMELVRQIRLNNLPWTSVLLNVSQAVPPGVGLTTVAVQSGTLSITGETPEPNRVVTFWSRMNGSAFFSGANVTSILQDDHGTTFQMSASLPAPGTVAGTGTTPGTLTPPKG